MPGSLTQWLVRTRQQTVAATAVCLVGLSVIGATRASATTATPTPTKTCTPGFNPPPGCAYEGPPFTPTPTRTPNSSGLCGEVCDGQPCGGARCPGGGPQKARRCTVPTAYGCECEPFECPTPPPTPTPAVLPCVGDCNGDAQVTIDELITMVNIVLGNTPVNGCAQFAYYCETTCLPQIIGGVNNALLGCPLPTSTPIPTPTPTTNECMVGSLACNVDGACGLTGRLCGLVVDGKVTTGRCCQNALGASCVCIPDGLDCACPELPTPTPTPHQSPICPTVPVSTPRCFIDEYYSCGYNRAGCQVCGCCFEFVGGCCNFGGRLPCFPLRAGQDAGKCTYLGGSPTGCPTSVICNESTGQCELQ